METKKAWELFFRAYPSSQAFALPLLKDKQHKPAHAEWYYTIVYNTLYADASLHYLCEKIQSCEVWLHRQITLENVFSPFGCPYKRSAQPQDSIKIFDSISTLGADWSRVQS